ncbi:uncharacterized protein BXZ73DRAFT_100731 [Epithele typhae]|uniref:uncharacterized protein n=1 Tax=Epithele typhae TaxID=378194 RepID=UPI0020077B28|nr:uncharacterized protein BXZ73DRAFT_100731 [Epithele typhae]KAH9934541.1 hypothetical protein BXZ73DRAFT_100731 [Epithele typhae]
MGDKIDYQYFLPHESGKTHLVGATQVTVYQGIFDDDSRDKTHDYLYIGKFYPDFYIRTSDFDTRLKDATLEADFEKAVKAIDNPGGDATDFFHVWKASGGWFASPTSFMHRVSRGMTLTKWSYNQKRLWEKIIDSAEVATLPVSHNPVMGRFLTLPSSIPLSEFVVSTTKTEDYLSLAELQTAVDEFPIPRPRVMSYAAADQDASLCLVGSSFLGLYETWTSSATYAALCAEKDVDPLDRPWPANRAAATNIAQLFHNPNPTPGTDEGVETSTTVTAKKIKAAENRRKHAPGQNQVMDGVSATVLAGMLWGGPGRDMKGTAEWLHRSAFRFGGLGDAINPFSSQNKSNLVFGTKECNTHMIRAEDAITKLIDHCPTASSGLLVTENVLAGNVRHLQADGSVVENAIPDWFQDEWNNNPGTMWWLSMQLTYAFNIDLNPQHINLTMNARVDFDPFNRYRPLLYEAKLDDVVLNIVLERFGLVAGPAPAPTPAPVPGPPPKKAAAVTISMVAPQVEQKLDTTRDLYISAYLNQALSLSDHRTSSLDLPARRAANSSSIPLRVSGQAPSSRRVAQYAAGLANVTPGGSPSLRASGAHGFALPGLSLATIATSADSEAHADWNKPFVPDLVTLNGVMIYSPKIVLHEGSSASYSSSARLEVACASASVDTLHTLPLLVVGADPPPNGFTLEGDIALFGISDLTAKFYSWHGPVPHDSKVANPLYEMAIVPGDFKLSSVLDVLKGTPFDALTFRDATFMRQDIAFDPTKAPGWHVDVDFPINADAGLLYDVLHTMLGVQDPSVHLHAGLGLNHNWNNSLGVHSFTLDGSIPGMVVKICDGLTLTSVGVQLLGVRRVIPGGVKPKTSMEYGFGVFGSFALKIPGALVPLELDYQMQKIGPVLRLAATLKADTWDSPFGITGLKLSEVSFEADLVAKAPMKTFSFDVSAVFQYGVTTAVFNGSYAAGGHFSLSATVSNFDIITISDIFESLTGESLDLPDIDFKVGSATVTVASGTGLLIALTDVEIEGHVSANAVLSINSRGAMIRGDITSTDGISFGEVELKKAYIEIDLRKGMEDSGVMLGGEISIASLTIDALVHLYRGADKSMQWTAFASLTTDTQILAISKVVPALRDTFLDLALTKVVFVAASQDDPLVSGVVTTGYRIHKGVQVCAVLSPIKELDSLMRSSAPTSGLVLSAGWSRQTGFELEVLMPTESIVNFGNGITTDPFALRILFGGSQPTLELSAGINIPTPPDGDKLKFSLVLDINLVGASATAQMHGNWKNPLGLGKDVAIGPDVALSIGIIFAQFVATGTISKFGVAGGMAIGKVSAQVAMQVSEDPTQELLMGEVKRLDLDDIVSFANVITGLDIPQPPNLVDFQDISLYVCPFGTMIGTIVYPQGFSFKAAMVLFGKHVDAACVVDNTQVLVQGGVDNFVLGPLSVHGTNGPRAVIKVNVGPKEQHILVDGVVSFLDASVALHAEVGILPKPMLQFYLLVKFTDLFLFNLQARLEGDLSSYQSLENADFTFYALMQQDILVYVRGQVDAQFEIFRSTAEEGFESAKKALQDEEEVVNKNIDAAKEVLRKAQEAWNRKYHEIVDGAQKIIDDYLSAIDDLQRKIGYAQTDYDNAMTEAENAVQKANNDRAAAMREANAALESAKNEASAGINSAIDSLNDAKDFLNRNFGYAVRDIENAQRKVDGIQSDIDTCQGHIDWCNGRPWWDIPAHAAVAAYYVELAGLEAARGIAWTALEVAKAVVKGAGYVAAEGAIGAAELALQGARETAKGLIDAAEAGVTTADKISEGALDVAKDTLEAVRYGGKYVVLQGARDALKLYEEANRAAFEAARKAIDTVEECFEFVTFEAAQKGLDAAKTAATTALKGLQKALDLAESVEDIALKVGQWLVDQMLELVDIQRIELSGSLRAIVGAGGGAKKPFTVHVKYVLMGNPGTFDGVLDLSDIVSFIVSLFNQMLDEVEGKLPVPDKTDSSEKTDSGSGSGSGSDTLPTGGGSSGSYDPDWLHHYDPHDRRHRGDPPPFFDDPKWPYEGNSHFPKLYGRPVARSLASRRTLAAQPGPFRAFIEHHEDK